MRLRKRFHLAYQAILGRSSKRHQKKRFNGLEQRIMEQFNGLEQRISEVLARMTPLPSEPVAQPAVPAEVVAALNTKIDELHNIIQYSVVKEIDIVEYRGNYYFWYTHDKSYEWISAGVGSGLVRVKVPVHELPTSSLPASTISLDTHLSKLRNRPSFAEEDLKEPILAHFHTESIQFIFIDIGANVGTTCIPIGKFIKSFGIDGSVISFEPGFVSSLVQRNTVINHVSDVVEIVPAAVSDRDSFAIFSSWVGHSESNSLHDFRELYPGLALASSQVVPTVRLDNFVRSRKVEQKLIVKIDAEGNDQYVLRGMSGISPDQLMVVIFEYYPKYLDSTSDSQAVLSTLSNDYTILNSCSTTGEVRWGFNGPIEPDDFTSFEEEVAKSPRGWTDIVAISRRLPGHDKLIASLLEFSYERQES